MRNYIRDPRWEILPRDEANMVSAVFRLQPHMPCRLGCPMQQSVDPTRRMEHATKLLVLEPHDLEMHHFTLVRKDIQSKFDSVSNRANYLISSSIGSLHGADASFVLANFVRTFDMWNPKDFPFVHPHSTSRRSFATIEVVPNLFDIDLPFCKHCPDLPVGAQFQTVRVQEGDSAKQGVDGGWYNVEERLPGSSWQIASTDGELHPAIELVLEDANSRAAQEPHPGSPHSQRHWREQAGPVRAVENQIVSAVKQAHSILGSYSGVG